MFDRELFHWKVELQNGNTGEVGEVDFFTYWSPEEPDAMEQVMQAAGIMASCKEGPRFHRTTKYAAIRARLVDPESAGATQAT